MRPLILPRLVASGLSVDTADSLKSSNQSSSTISSDCTTPATPISTARSPSQQLKNSSSTSSLTSTPTCNDASPEMTSSKSKLTKLAEEPVELDDEDIAVDGQEQPCNCNADWSEPERWQQHHSDVHAVRSRESDLDLADSFFADDAGLASRRSSKRRRSTVLRGDITTRLGRRFPSLSHRWRDKTDSLVSGPGLQSSTTSFAPSSRSSSLTSAVYGLDTADAYPPVPSVNTSTTSHEMGPSSPNDTVTTELTTDPIDREQLNSTPLLPPLMMNFPRTKDNTPAQSPLQSPSVAETSSNFSPVYASSVLPTPPLSTQPSISSFHRTMTGQATSSSDIPPLIISDPNDKWSIALGHANFTIFPEPYLPAYCDVPACRTLFSDWELARNNYTKHQVRTGEHYGTTSKTYALTEQKWREVDARWKANHELALKERARLSHDAAPITPMEPAPLSKMPSLDDPAGEGKFPKRGDEDIVGPMVQIAAQIQPRRSRRTSFLRILKDVKFPGALLGRPAAAATGIRVRR
ncbi:hypothetical protein K402DRAFT_410060 [Aulographum hederae CBS 113979]|uniref:Uncharacterized protein n=1 Tax=Aulographum hederae CBS 113979 TaxID=1176131 RepID=A0A6G1HDH6_9PEZI|nr:hypothetical protein K402DRAFT_410060 [Aulographum hederae CBS 113979]